MEDDDPIKKLLRQTGWSYSEVLKKLEAYKDQFPSDSKSKTADREFKKDNDSENGNICNIELSSKKNENVDSAIVKKEDVTLENNIKAEIKTDEEESTNPDKTEKGNTELKTNKVCDAESRNNKGSCVKLDDIKEKHNTKYKETTTDEQECKISTDHIKENIKLKEHLENNSDSNGNEKDKLENSNENPKSEESRDEELENIIQRLEQFIEENAESDNEESYAEIHTKRSEYENNEKMKLEISESKKIHDVINTVKKVVEQNANLEESKKEILENIAERESESENHDVEKLEECIEKINNSVTKITNKVMKENIESDDHVQETLENEITTMPKERKVQNTESQNHIMQQSDNVKCNSESETHKEDKLEKIIENKSETKEINSIIEQSTDIERNTESEMLKSAIKCNPEAEPSREEKSENTAEQNTELNNCTKETSGNTIECNLESEPKDERNSKSVAEKDVESKKPNYITEDSKSIMDTETESDRKDQSKSEDHEKSKEIVRRNSKSEEIITVIESEKIVESNTKSKEHRGEKLDNTIKQTLEAGTSKEEKSEEVGNPSDSEDSEEDKLENIIERLEKIIEGRAGLDEDEEETPESTESISKESANSNDVTQNLKESTNESHTEPLNQKDNSLNVLETDSKIKSSLNQTNQNISEDLLVEVNVVSQKFSRSQTQSRKATSKNLKRNLRNIRLRIIRKCKNTLHRQIKKKNENSPKVIQTEDIRSKLKEQLELLRTKRKTGESPLISSPPKSSCSLKFHQRNVNRLNTITSTLIRKLTNGNIKVLPETVDDSSDSDLEVQDSDFDECKIYNEIQTNQESGKSQPEETVVLSNETDLMIVNVVGGYTSPTPDARLDIDFEDYETERSEALINENNTHEGNSDHDRDFVLNGITPTKTTDVTKIKGWKNKKFAIANKEEQTKPSDKLLFQLMHDYSEPSNQPKTSNLDDKIIVEQSPPILPSSEKPENTNQTQSAFISDELDQYLTENSELKISYEVPKLEAEQTITTKYIDIKFPVLPQQNTQLSHTKNRESYKPKTLAEKRKMLAEGDRPGITGFLDGMNSKQRKKYEESVLNMRTKLIKEDIPFTRRCFMTSTSITNTHNFVEYNGKRLKVASNTNKEVIAQIREKRKVYKNLPPPRPKVHRQRKPSLLSELKTDINKFSCDSTEWETLQMKLPKLTLEVKPQIGKRIHPSIEHLIKSDDFILAANRVEFALSTLKVKKSATKPQIFTFPLSYNNNEKYMNMRRRYSAVIDISSDEKPNESDNDIAETVTDVVNKMLDYIDISEETKDIIQDETNPENDVKSDLPKQKDNFPDKNWRRRKRKTVSGEKGVRRTTLEMKRLNCKILSISLDEENGENNLCSKEFCKLGCICKSIECSSTNLLVSHCGLSRCMFKCKCKCRNMGAGEKFSLPAGTDIFSEGMINRLQDEAKKNLAKVEKEFTQTVIKTNNQIIVVGDSKDRRRRATKMPKKYIDFVEEDPSDNPVSKNAAAESKYRALTERSPIERLPVERLPIERSPMERLLIEQPFTKPSNRNSIVKTAEVEGIKHCFVKLFSYDFSGIMPFCLVHLLYKCHCKNKTVFDSSTVGDKNIVACTYVDPPKSAPQLVSTVKNRLQPKIDKTFNKELNSSRTRGLATSYYLIRNKSLSHKRKIRKSAKKLQKKLEIYLHRNAAKIMEDSERAPEERDELPDRPDTPKEPKRQRKQSLIVLEDPGSDTPRISSPERVDLQQFNRNDAARELKLQRRKTKPNTKITRPKLVNKSETIGESPAKVLFGDTSTLKNEFFSLLGKKTSQLRLLPWTTLATRFDDGSFQVWYSNISKMCPLVITENGKRPSYYHYNIRLFEEISLELAMPSNIIHWLLNKKVPLDKSVENILLILSRNKKSSWEICGLCEKNQTDPKTKENVSISLIHSWDEPQNNSDATMNVEPQSPDLEDADTSKNSTDNEQNVPDDTETIVHENLQENKKVMYCSKRRFQPKKLMSDEIDDDSLNIRQVLWAPIPSVTLACKWRVIYMNVGFAYLSLSRSSYTIKYEDIMRAMQIAHNDKITIVLKSEELQKNYPHRNFGIYCVHNYTDKVFIGPYFLNENHDLDTLTYVNQVLVNTSLLSQIKGKGDSGSGRWFHQATNSEENVNVDDDVVIIQEPAPVVDLTCESDEESSNIRRKGSSNLELSPSKKNHATLLKNILLTPLSDTHPDLEEEITKAEKALNTLLKKGQINVNKTLVHLDSSKPSSKINSSPQPASSNASLLCVTPKNATNAVENQNMEDISESPDDDRLVIDEGTTENLNQQSDAEGTNRNHINPNKEDVIGNDLQVNRYLVTNIPGLGYISAYQHETTKIVNVVCPVTKKMKQFSTPEAAIAALERVFTNKFIRVPTNFKLEFNMLEKLESATDVPLDRSVLHGYHIVGAFGVRNLLRCTATELENFGLDKAQITHMWTLFEKKLLWVPLCQLGKLLSVRVRENAIDLTLDEILSRTTKEIQILQRESALLIKEKIDLESKKVVLAEKCSKLQYQLPPNQRAIAQQRLDRIVNFSNRQTLLTNSVTISGNIENSIPRISQVSEPIILEDDEENDDMTNNSKDSLLATSTSKLTTITAPIKFRLTKGPVYSGTSLLSGKKVQRGLLTKQFKTPSGEKDNKYVVVQRKRNASGNLVSAANTVDLSRCTLQIKPLHTEGRMLVKEVPIKVRKDILKAANNSGLQLQQQQKSVFLCNGSSGSVIRTFPASTTMNMSKNIFSSVPTITKVPKINNSVIATTNTSGNSVKYSISHLNQSRTANVVSSTGLPVTHPTGKPITMVPSTSKSIGSSIKANTMATLTPMPKSPGLVLTNSTAKSTPNYIAIKEGNNLKYFQLVSESKTPVLQPVQAIKRPTSSIKIQPPLKKIAPAPATSLLTNQKTDK